MRKMYHKCVMAALATAGLLVASQPASAVVVPLTGGEAGEGLTINTEDVVYAYNTGQNTNPTIQGQEFSPFLPPSTASGNVTTVGFGNYAGDPFAPQFTIEGADDEAMYVLLRSLIYTLDASGPGTLTITGLDANTVYRLDLLVHTPGDRTETFTINGVLTDSFTAQGGSSYNVTNLVNSGVSGPEGTGQIVVSLTGAGNPIINGFVVSVPEPASLGVVALAGLALLGRRRRA